MSTSVSHQYLYTFPTRHCFPKGSIVLVQLAKLSQHLTTPGTIPFDSPHDGLQGVPDLQYVIRSSVSGLNLVSGTKTTVMNGLQCHTSSIPCPRYVQYSPAVQRPERAADHSRTFSAYVKAQDLVVWYRANAACITVIISPSMSHHRLPKRLTMRVTLYLHSPSGFPGVFFKQRDNYMFIIIVIAVFSPPDHPTGPGAQAAYYPMGTSDVKLYIHLPLSAAKS